MPHYNKALQYGDVIKLVGVARLYEDNHALAEFRNNLRKSHDTPLIAINMAELGKLSRIENGFLTPVWHPKLSIAAAPGQMSASQIRQALSLHGVIQPKKFAIFGSPVGQSRSPPMHNALFAQNGLPHVYGRLESSKVTDDIVKFIMSPEFGGASVTIPLKQEFFDLIDELAPDVEAIGALNTIIPEEYTDENGSTITKLVGRNTDWQGMLMVLDKSDLAGGRTTQSGFVVGGGGTARAAIYALNKMEISPIYLIGRSKSKLQAVANDFPSSFHVHVVQSDEDIASISPAPTVGIGTIPGDHPLDPALKTTIEVMLNAGVSQSSVLLEMAYKPADTPIKLLAEECGWKTVSGLEVLVAQGVYQFEHWTGIKPHYETARVSAKGLECGPTNRDPGCGNERRLSSSPGIGIRKMPGSLAEMEGYVRFRDYPANGPGSTVFCNLAAQA